VATDFQKPTTRYRSGERRPHIITAKTAAVRDYRRRLADSVFGPQAQERLLKLIHQGVSLPQAARQIPVSPGQVHGRARWDPEFAALLDEALEVWSEPYKSDRCGSSTGYRNGCRCRRCRTAHNQDTERYR
jgi:hypothetical protein